MPRPVLFSISALLLAATALPASAGTPLGPQPANDPGSWISPDDYPFRSLRDEQEGVVGFVLTVDPQGAPLSCKVTQTSNFEPLDTQTCNLLMQRARFVSAHDARGRAVVGTYRSSVRWVIPVGEPQDIGPAELVTSFVIGADGKMSDCRIEKTAGKVPPAPSDFCSAKEKFVVPQDKDGKPIARRVRMRMTVEVEDLPTAQ